MKDVTYKKIALFVVFLWFAIGGVGHFVAPAFFLKIVPPGLPWRVEAVYISGFFELTGALALLRIKYRRAAGIGLVCLTIAVTPANVYMWLNPQLFPTVPEILLSARLILQIFLVWLILWSTQPTPTTVTTRIRS
jgi:uncharacterized membrane protein